VWQQESNRMASWEDLETIMEVTATMLTSGYAAAT